MPVEEDRESFLSAFFGWANGCFLAGAWVGVTCSDTAVHEDNQGERQRNERREGGG